MNITLTIQEQDYEFLVEALKLRTIAILDSLEQQYNEQQMASVDAALAKQEVQKQAQQLFNKELAEWKVQQEGNKVVATHAPWGLKKDGTPKKRPGRPVAK